MRPAIFMAGRTSGTGPRGGGVSRFNEAGHFHGRKDVVVGPDQDGVRASMRPAIFMAGREEAEVFRYALDGLQ